MFKINRAHVNAVFSVLAPRRGFKKAVRLLCVCVLILGSSGAFAQSYVVNLDFSDDLVNQGTGQGTGNWRSITKNKHLNAYYGDNKPAGPVYTSAEAGGSGKAIRLQPGYGVKLQQGAIAESIVANSLVRVESRFKLNSPLGGANEIDEKYIFDLVGARKAEYRGGISLRLRNNHSGSTSLEIVFSDAVDKRLDQHAAKKNHTNKIVLARDINVGDWIDLELVLDMTELPRPPLLTANIQIGSDVPRLFQKSVLNKYRWDDLLYPAKNRLANVLVGGTSAKVGLNDRMDGELDIDYLRVANTLLAESLEAKSGLVSALDALTSYVNEPTGVSRSQVETHAATVESYLGRYTQFHYLSDLAVKSAIDNYMDAYEQAKTPLFQNRRRKIDVEELDGLSRVLFHLQQNILVKHFSDADVGQVSELAYEARSVFPGLVQNPPSETISKDNAFTVVVDGTYVPYRATGSGSVAHRPTGYWAMAGRAAEVCVSSDRETDVRSADVQVYVGAHRAFQSHKRTNRFHKIATEFSFANQNGSCVTVANPFGGGIYVAVPAGSQLGALELEVSGGVVAAPYYDYRFQTENRLSGTSATTNRQWQSMMSATTLVPWTDMESDSQLLTVPTRVAQQVPSPADVMSTWDSMWDQVTVATGRYAQTSTMRRPRAMHIVVDSQAPCACGGYPTHFPAFAALYSDTAGDDVLKVTDPLFHRSNYVQQWFHEMGHGLRMPLIGQESETSPDWFNMLMQFGRNLNVDEAVKYSSRRRLDRLEAAMMWMTREEYYDVDLNTDFRDEAYEGNNGAMPGYLRKYSSRGSSKYADIAELFGWEALGDVY
ncbi:MAG: M60 family peptidase N-terminal accessory domain-containing protein, partial [Pseudomonadota bacterium]